MHPEKRINKKTDRRQKTEDRRQKTEDRRQKTEDRRQKTEDRRQKACHTGLTQKTGRPSLNGLSAQCIAYARWHFTLKCSMTASEPRYSNRP
ncbi:MAG: DUF874 family protein [Plesiomonas shigelloides]